MAARSGQNHVTFVSIVSDNDWPRKAGRAPNGTSCDAVPATWHEVTTTTDSAAFLNDVGIGTGDSIGRRQVKPYPRQWRAFTPSADDA